MTAPDTALHVVATIPVRPDAVAEARPILEALETATRAEDGCLDYAAYTSSEDGVMVTVETWRAEADLDAHMATPHIATAIGAVTPLLAGEIVIHRLAPL
ncbi:putative quinol monooxygenase [Nocardioides lentus]|uniref:Quinol monooxygenase n=1 Tax=Nocardioides lentus TaxID=338077 RepID=A0ABN2NXD1_9ACTN